MNAKKNKTIRVAIRIQGQVQGVGFRPFVYRSALATGVTGHVRNDSQGVSIEAQGWERAVRRFEKLLMEELPPLARMDQWARRVVVRVAGEDTFVIAESTHAPGDKAAAVTVDSAVCKECLREMFSKANRRFGHGLINCTNCGPRFSIIRDIPYDRPNTTMAEFAMCPDCRREYDDPRDRRFHAQPTCCPRCGPQVELVRVLGKGHSTKKVKGNPFENAAELLRRGKILAIKGIGGFHLAVRADKEQAVARLRRLKRRDAKPFALMCRDVKMARELVRLSGVAVKELTSPAAPIILAERKVKRGIANGVAPGTHRLGVMLPYTPMHHFLWKALERACRQARDKVPTLVMTSGNVSSEPLVIDNKDAIRRLGALCDGILWHDREIERCVDDSVSLDGGAGKPVLPIRRSRGYVPTAWRLPKRLQGGPTGLCLGGELKNTMAVVREGDIILSQHFGDLTHALGFEQFQKAIKDLVKLFELRLDFVAHDLHPGYMSTVTARELAKRCGARLIGVQHHVAHALGVLAEHGMEGPALVLVCDGTGYATDGTVWGGELLRVDGAAWERVGRLRPMRLPGGDAAALDPRRSGLSLLHQMDEERFEKLPAARQLFPKTGERRILASMIKSGLNSPWTSSTGRLFDAVAALLGICTTNEHEAQAAMALEAAAAKWSVGRKMGNRAQRIESCAVRRDEKKGMWELDPRPMIRALLDAKAKRVDSGELAWMFHVKLAEGWVRLARAAATDESPVLGASGGVLCNALLSTYLRNFSNQNKFRYLSHQIYPPTDAGLAFGQAMYARTFLSKARL